MSTTWIATPQQVERVIAAVLPHASDDKYLPSINCVQLELSAHSFLAVATDRYSLAVCRAALTDWDEEAKKVKKVAARLRPDDVKRLFTFLRPSRNLPAEWTLSNEALTVSIAGGDSLTLRTVQNIEFPSWRALVGGVAEYEPAPGEVMAFTPRIVDHFHKSAKALGELSMRWQFVTPLKPVIVRIGEDFLGMLMPARPADAPTLDLAAFGIESPKAVTAA